MRTRLFVLLTALAMALTACGGGSDDVTVEVPAAAPGEVVFVGDAALQWAETSKTATIGEDGSLDVTIVCEGGVPHNVVLEGVDDDAVIAECAGNDQGTGIVSVEPGTYTYYCAIPGHRAAGMVGEIAIE